MSTNTNSCPRSVDGFVHQLRNVRHSCQRARDLLGYQPPVSFRGSMDVFCDWYRRTHGFESSDWSLLRELYPPRSVVANS